MDRQLLREIAGLLEPLSRKLKLVASKAIIELVKDSAGLQGVQVSLLSGELGDDKTEHMQPGGLTHVPPSGSEGVYLSIGGVRDDGVVLCASHRSYRPKNLQAGETALYNAGDHQAVILLKQDGSIELTAPADAAVRITNPEGSFELAADGTVTINGVVISPDGEISAPGEITAMAGSPSTSVTVSQHKNAHPMGPSLPPIPGT